MSIPQVVSNPNQVPVLPVGRSLLSGAALEWLVKPSTLPCQLADSHLQVPHWLAHHWLSDELSEGHIIANSLLADLSNQAILH